jgi:Na+-driven multidrug efflux pump
MPALSPRAEARGLAAGFTRSFKTLIIIKAIVCLVFGVLLVFFPRWLLGLMGASLDPVGASRRVSTGRPSSAP